MKKYVHYWFKHNQDPANPHLTVYYSLLPGQRVVLNKMRRQIADIYHPETLVIRLWMRPAIRKEVTSFGTFLSTLCHEFCHHLSPVPLFDTTTIHSEARVERALA